MTKTRKITDKKQMIENHKTSEFRMETKSEYKGK